MESFPPTLDVRFKKDIVIDHVRDRYQYNAYLLGKIFSVVKAGEAQYDSDDSSDSSASQEIIDRLENEQAEESAEGKQIKQYQQFITLHIQCESTITSFKDSEILINLLHRYR